MICSTRFRLAIATCGLVLGACSAAPAPTVIIMDDTPAATSSSNVGARPPPISFAGPDATTSPPPDPGSNPGNDPGGSNPGNGSAGGASGVPCDVATYLAAKCTSCHGNPPIPSALAGLVTYDDLKAMSKEDPTQNEAELSVVRMKNAASPMPPGALPPPSDVAILETWINAGYPKGSCGGDGGAAPPPPPPPPSVFEGAPPFVAGFGRNAHNAGEDCMRCHRDGGEEAPRFSFGGTLYDASGRPVAGAEVRLVEANGNAISVYTAGNGTFYAGSGFAAPAHVGVRNAAFAADMLTALQGSNGGACSSCHCTGGTCSVPPVHLP